jgi:membrane associated rhomboid family serine protease
MARSTSTTLALPPFEGATRLLVLWNTGAFFALAILYWVSPKILAFLMLHFSLIPKLVLTGQVWQLVTYSFINFGILGIFFAMLSLWFIGNFLESSFGSRYLYQTYFASVIGGAIIATLVAYTRVFRLQADLIGNAQWAGIFGLLVVIARFFGDAEILFLFVIRMKIKYLVVISILLFTARLLMENDAFNALLQLGGGLAGYAYSRLAPRRGYALSLSLSEPFYGLRNKFYRAKRRRAAKKFEVYMRGQNRDVHFDKNGRYVEPDDRDPNDKRWMN